MNPRNFFAELKRRDVSKVAVACAVVAWPPRFIAFAQKIGVMPKADAKPYAMALVFRRSSPGEPNTSSITESMTTIDPVNLVNEQAAGKGQGLR